MHQSVTFPGATLLAFGRNQAGASAKIEFPLTVKVIKAMGWGDLQDYESKASLEGDLAATIIELSPSDEGMKRRAIQVDVQRVHKFVATKQEIEGSRGKGKRWLVQCDIAVRDESGCAKLEGYMLSVPKGDVRVSYEKQAVQQDVPGMEKSGCPLCDDGIALRPDNPKKHVNGSKCTALPVQEVLAN